MQHCFFTKNKEFTSSKLETIRQNASAILDDFHNKNKRKGFAFEALQVWNEALEMMDGVDKRHKAMLKVVYLGRNLERKSFCATTIIGKIVGLANIGTTLDDDYFIFNKLIGCAMVSCDGHIDKNGIITGDWLVGFENIPGVVALFDFSNKETEVVFLLHLYRS